ncbi:hypothetical protein G647_09406 [Cladophialophora carrionii CBS 160.54]|uniref:Uncharacterized protein n=1 Tax=Cladophialophora carrionii CBS 160.54 TaxID=1279043 RepID=V9D0S1_9EURO|nr:uncharacterized protein G647_09406 [Cladophialophora carrionii CBS 160.54]ETI19572.1 hypothetical protein G647_09406 [Cladophialophora carrionii CBS 160.54]
MANPDLRTARRNGHYIEGSMSESRSKVAKYQAEATEQNALEKVEIAVATASNLNSITECASKLCEEIPIIQGWEVFRRFRGRLRFSHKVHQTFRDTLILRDGIDRDALDELNKILSGWHDNLQNLSGDYAENEDIPMASELGLLIELYYRTSTYPLRELGNVKDFLNGLAVRLGELQLLPGRGRKAAGVPHVLFFCVGHPRGPVCAANQPSYTGCPELKAIFNRLHAKRLDKSPQSSDGRKMESRESHTI